MKRIVALMFLVLLSGTVLAADDRTIAHSYFLKARDLAERGAGEAAQRLLVESLDLNPDYSETLFLLGKLYCASQGSTGEGIPLIEKALKINSWAVTTPFEAREMLAQVYVRTRRFREALTLLNGLKAERISSPAVEISRALAATGLGDHRQADAILETAERTFPGDRRIVLTHIRQLNDRGLRSRASLLTERGLKEFPEEPAFLFHKIALLTRPEEKKALFDAYQARGGRDPRLLLYLLDTDSATFRRAVDFSFNLRAGEDVLLLETLVNRLRQNKAKFSLIVPLAGMDNGEKTVDADGDGFFEEKYFLKSGEVVRVLFDRDQNGIAEQEILLEKNRPVNVILRRSPEEETRYLYKGYPRVSRMELKDRQQTLTYELVPDQVLFAPIKSMPAPAELKLRIVISAGTVFPSEQTVSRQAWALVEDPVDGRLPRRRWDLYSGKKLLLHEDGDRDGVFERTVIFNDRGVALRGQVDNDDDGFAEIQEWYENGRLIRLEYDEDRDGRPEYEEKTAGGVKEWDLDGDGVSDVKERKLPNGKTVWEYSGMLRTKK